nr:iron chelate uptake ABC transporter family permease subunit [Spiractinospora alimapuensis]
MVRVGRWVAVPVRRRSVVVAVILLVGVVASALATLTLGSLGIAVGRLPAVVGGGGDATEHFVFDRLRGPRLAVGIGVGAALGIAGALFQSVTRNPLGSPDVIGLGSGAGAGAAFAALILPGVVPIPVGALAGAVVAIGIVALSTGTGLRHPGRLIVAGIGVAAMAQAFTHFVVAVMVREEATQLWVYLNGSLNARDWNHAAVIWTVLVVAVPVLMALSRPVTLGEMGDETAETLGAPASATRTGAIMVSVVLSAAAVSVAGPIAFVALTAPQIARRLVRGGGPSFLVSALVGALLLVCADLVVQQVPLGEGLPVGIVTMALGGVYLGHLLIREWRKGTL